MLTMRNPFRPSVDSLLGEYGRHRHRQLSRHWWPILNLVWSIPVFLIPLRSHSAVTDWLWPTAASYAVFLWLYFRGYYRNRHQVGLCALGIAALGFALVPWNAGAHAYPMYACALLAFATRPPHALAAMLLVLTAFAVEWVLLGFNTMFLLTIGVVGLTVGLMNLAWAREMRADAELRLSHDEVRRLAALAERERIGRDLHDLLGHTLSLVALKSELAGKLIGRDPQAARRELLEVSRVAREALTQVRSAVTGIRAAGLAAELASARLLLDADGVSFHYEIEPLALPAELESALAMIVREAVTNIQRHARARRAHVVLVAEGGGIALRIEDDGRGGATEPGNGLNGMRERIGVLKGSLRIDSVPGRGTRIEARLPLPERTAPLIETATGAVAA